MKPNFYRLTLWTIIGLLALLLGLEALAIIARQDYLILLRGDGASPLQIANIQFDYTLRTVALGGAVLGIVVGVLGCFAVLRHESLIGDALAHAALPGVAIGFLFTGRDLIGLLIGAGIASGLAILFIRLIINNTRLKQDTALAVVLTSFFAMGLLFLSYIQSRNDASQAGLSNFIFGQAAAIVRSDVILMTALGAFTLLTLALFWKELKLITFDQEFARTNGYPVTFLNILLSTLIVVAIVIGLQLAGVILIVGLLIAPAAAARQWTHHLETMVVIAAIIGAISGAGGAIASGAETNLPTGPLIIVIASIFVVVSLTLAPDRGIITRYWRQRRDRHHLLKEVVMSRHATSDSKRPTPIYQE